MSYYTQMAKEALHFTHKEATGPYVRAALSLGTLAVTTITTIDALKDSHQAVQMASKDGVLATRRARTQIKTRTNNLRMDVAKGRAKVRTIRENRRTAQAA